VEQLGSFSHAADTVATAWNRSGARRTFILDREVDAVRCVSKHDAHSGGIRVLSHVGQCLLRDPVDGQPCFRLKLDRRALDLKSA
jgi:hypothetical protein